MKPDELLQRTFEHLKPQHQGASELFEVRGRFDGKLYGIAYSVSADEQRYNPDGFKRDVDMRRKAAASTMSKQILGDAGISDERNARGVAVMAVLKARLPSELASTDLLTAILDAADGITC